jgi:Bacterial low temperature requirement A protein (LtrA)
VSEPREQVVRVSTLELFFDLVFVFTITQLTAVLVGRPSAAGHGMTFPAMDGEGRNRTGDTMIFSHVLYRLSYLAREAGC